MILPILAFAAGIAAAPPPDSLRAEFELGARTRVTDVKSLPVAAFNDTLAAAQARGEPWTRSFIAIALRFAGPEPQGREQSVEATTGPREWEPGMPLDEVRITIEDRRWMDDAVVGERWVIRLAPSGPGGALRVVRGLHAWECSRSMPGTWFYSAQPCP
jgi:hypothetical protein